MSEFIESHSVSKLLGPPPGYVGWEQGGQLTEAMFKRPFQVILLANIEKAHKDILGILFQILEEGHITDSKGKKVDFRNSIIIMTSSIGSDNFHRFRIGAGIGFGLSAGIPDEKKEMPVNEKRTREIEDSVLAEAKKFFLSELWNRIEEKIVFHPLAENDLIDVAHMMINESSRFLEKEKGIIYSATDDLVKWLLSKGGISKDTGTRPLRSLIQTKVETRLAEGILRNEIHRGDRIIMDISGDEILAKKNQ
jgi:ATP-dependent Clp protease ATP-binding subunit ClpC